MPAFDEPFASTTSAAVAATGSALVAAAGSALVAAAGPALPATLPLVSVSASASDLVLVSAAG
ncbi:hypothetical protein [Actinoplanes sp. NPDC089786]|uniref:hypothetical protein n=1 Tax=Actinoplanes sp. NPDC089786 TaxID=3155185 RepID=UPI00341F297F